MPRTGHSRPPHHHPNTCANSIGDTVPMPDISTPQGPVHRSSGTLASAPEGACVYRMITTPVRDYSRRDRMLATQAATSLLPQLMVWLALFHLGFALVLQAFDRVGWPHPRAQAGSSLLPPGYAGPTDGPLTVVDHLAAGHRVGRGGLADRLSAHAVQRLQPPR